MYLPISPDRIKKASTRKLSLMLAETYEMYVLENISVLALLIDLLLHKEIKKKTAQCPFTYYINFVAWHENN